MNLTKKPIQITAVQSNSIQSSITIDDTSTLSKATSNVSVHIGSLDVETPIPNSTIPQIFYA